ncbi:MAG: VOC family protein [Rhodobacteraceae bacterium]|nr:VOC family protein [Paracoccaceae bacterium]
MTIRWDHASLAVTDLDSAIAFFCNGLGFKVTFVERDMSHQIASVLGVPGATCDLAQLVLPGQFPKLELIAFRAGDERARPLRPSAPGMGHVALRATDFDQRLQHLIEIGARPVGQVTDFSDGRSVYLATSFGAFLELEEDLSAQPDTQADLMT